LPRRARIISPLAGLATDVVTAAVLVIIAAAAVPVLIVTVCWRLLVLQLLSVVHNTVPTLEVDGHVALTDYLDQPDLGPVHGEAWSPG
jgi:Zn-dependent protease